MSPPVLWSRGFGRAVPRRVRAVLAGAAVAVLIGAPAAAEDATTSPEPTGTGPTVAIGPQTPGTTVCAVDDPDLDEITGMVATPNGIYAVEGGTTFQPDSVEIWTIDATTCAASSQSYGFFPIDPQDLALGTDGALWVADIGLGVSGGRERATIERVDLASGDDAVPHRVLYPGEAFNATAVLLEADNTPIIIANSGSQAVLYKPNAPLPADVTEGLPTLTQVGTFTPVNTDTETPRGAFGRTLVTGAALSPDRSRVVLRTQSDAYEFTVDAGSDLVTAITQGTPRITPLPNEENGQAISYSADGTQFFTLSSVANPTLRAYTPFVPQAPAGDGGAPAPGGGGGGSLTFDEITLIAGAVGFAGFLAVVAGVIGIVLHRRRYPADIASRDRRPSRERRGRRDWDDADDYGYGGYDNEEYSRPRSGRAPRPRDEGGEPWPEESGPRSGQATARVTPGGDDYGRSYGAPPSGPDADHGAQGPRPRSGGQTHGSGGGPTHGSGGGGQVYGGGQTYIPDSGGGGHVSGSGGGSGSGGSSGRVYGSARPSSSSGGVYGRPRHDPDDDDRRGSYRDDDRRGGYGDDDEPRRGGYGRDNVDL